MIIIIMKFLIFWSFSTSILMNFDVIFYGIGSHTEGRESITKNQFLMSKSNEIIYFNYF
jgi:hypothetical protein